MECEALIPQSALICPYCGTPQKRVCDTVPDMEQLTDDLKPQKVKLVARPAFNAGFTSRKGNRMIRVDMCGQTDTGKTIAFSEFFDFGGEASAYGQIKARAAWKAIAKTAPPASLEEARARLPELEGGFPREVWVRKHDQYYHVTRWV